MGALANYRQIRQQVQDEARRRGWPSLGIGSCPAGKGRTLFGKGRGFKGFKSGTDHLRGGPGFGKALAPAGAKGKFDRKRRIVLVAELKARTRCKICKKKGHRLRQMIAPSLAAPADWQCGVVKPEPTTSVACTIRI